MQTIPLKFIVILCASMFAQLSAAQGADDATDGAQLDATATEASDDITNIDLEGSVENAVNREGLTRRRYDVRILLNGRSDQMAYEAGWIRFELSFAETKKLHYVNQYIKDGDDPKAADFSRRIRPHLAR